MFQCTQKDNDCWKCASATPAATAADNTTVGGTTVDETSVIVGRLLRKKKLSKEWVILNILPDSSSMDKSVPIFVHRVRKTWFPQSILRISIFYDESLRRVAVNNSIHLIQCAPNPQAVKACLLDMERYGLQTIPLSTLLPYGPTQHDKTKLDALREQLFGDAIDSTQQQQEQEVSTSRNNYEFCDAIDSTQQQQGQEDSTDRNREISELRSLTTGDANSNIVKIQSLSIRQIADIVRNLLGVGDQPRANHRPTHTKRRARDLLEYMEASASRLWTPVEWHYCTDEMDDSVMQTAIPINLPGSIDDDTNEVDDDDNVLSTSTIMMSSKGTRSREEYLMHRKHPQIRWMVNRIGNLLTQLAASSTSSSSSSSSSFTPHLLDVGGGRGDLSVALARHFPQARITLVDCHARSLEAAELYAKSVQCHDRITFVEADFGEFIRREGGTSGSSSAKPLSTPDCVVALHACGDLSDAALAYAVEHQCGFCICPCCYSKRHLQDFVPPYLLEWQHMASSEKCLEQEPSTRNDTNNDTKTRREWTTILGKMAETDDRTDLCRRAALVFNSLRLESIASSGRYHLHLEEYDVASSNRNLVLVGIPK